MPSIVTHHAFANDVYNKLSKDCQQNINKKTYEVFSQSFDYFFYYNFLDFKLGQTIRNIGKNGHRSNTQLYIFNIIKNIQKYHLENDPEALAYLYGTINHYTLDTICHPFIFYKTGCFYKKNKSTYKYRGMHTKMEKNIDAYYSKLCFKKPIYKLNINKDIIHNIKFSNNLKKLIDTVFKETYNKDNISHYFIKSYHNSKIVFSLFIKDYFGLKLLLYKFIDLFNRHNTPLKYYSFHIKKENITFLNLKKDSWCHPCDNNLIFEKSFIDLYNEAVDKSILIINEINKVLYENKDIKELINIVENLSYITGFPIEKNKPLKYFEY